ncbi:MAG: hypothetical protein HUU16_04900 [Candidatus Omnitrophica bacterium]|nr:hypothetical protein [Candidatus Omnitrophota bacterium]
MAALEEATGDEPIRALMLLGGSSSTTSVETVEEGRDSTDRVTLRKRLIEARGKELQGEIGTTLDKLRELSLSPRGGRVLHTVVVEGPAQSIVKALEMSEVQHATLDRKVRVVHPRPPRTFK